MLARGLLTKHARCFNGSFHPGTSKHLAGSPTSCYTDDANCRKKLSGLALKVGPGRGRSEGRVGLGLGLGLGLRQAGK